MYLHEDPVRSIFTSVCYGEDARISIKLLKLECSFQALRGQDLRQWALRMPRGDLRPSDQGEGGPCFRECFSDCHV